VRTFALFILFLFVLVPVRADDHDQEVARALVKVQEDKAAAQTWEGRNSDQPYLVLLSEYETIVHPDWSSEETYHTRIRIQQESARQLAQWPIYYNKSREEITDVKAFVETPEGKKFDATGIEDAQVYEDSPMYADMKVKVVNLPQVDIGNVLDVTVKSKVSRKEIPGQFWDAVPYPFVPTKFARYTYILPQDKGIEFTAYKNDHKPLIEKKDGTIKYSFVFEETDDVQDEELMPPSAEVKGGLYLSSIKGWKVIADWYRDLANKNTVEDAEISAKAAELIDGKTTQKDKARAILEFAQDGLHHVAMNFGEHTVEPHPTNKVFSERYADGKDLALLVRQMFKAAGIASNICLMTGEFAGNPQNAAPSPSVFEHVLLETQLDGEKYFVDPQAKGFDLGQYPSGYDHAYVLVIEDAGYRFAILPVTGEGGNSLVSQSDITLAPDGSATFQTHVQLPLDASQSFRMQWAAATGEDKNKFFESLESNYTEGGSLLSHAVKGVDNRYGPVEFDFKYYSPNAYPVVNDMILLKEAEQANIPDFSAQERKYPIFVPANSLIRNTNTYHVPDGYKIDFVPQDFKMSIDFVDVSANYDAKGDSVTVNTVYRMKRALIPAQRYPEIRDFRKELSKKSDQYIILRQRSHASSQAKEWFKKQ